MKNIIILCNIYMLTCLACYNIIIHTKGLCTMALTASKSKSNQKYRDKFEYITTRVSAEEKQTICNHAESMGESLNSFMRRAAEEAMERDIAQQNIHK